MITKQEFESNILKLVENRKFDVFIAYLTEILNNPDNETRRLIEKYTNEWRNLKKGPYLKIMDENEIKVAYNLFLKDNLKHLFSEITDEKLQKFHVEKIVDNEQIIEAEEERIYDGVSFKRRFFSILIDIGIILIFVAIRILISNEIVLNIDFTIGKDFFQMFFNLEFIFDIVILYLFINKDIIRGQSIGKHLLKLQIIDVRSNKNPSQIKLVLRNFLFIIFPIELIFAIIKPKRQITDYIFKTKIVDYSENNNKRNSILNFVLSFLISIFYILIVLIIFYNLIKTFLV